MIRHWGILLVLVVAVGQPVWAQDSSATAPDSVQNWHEGAWTRIVERGGLGISYIFYSEADNQNNGVVLRLRNQNEFSVRYAFTIIFRSPDDRATARVEGALKPGEMQTGDASGLFWVPFKDRQRIGELGLRDVEVTRVRASEAPQD